jgi:hypothetical protein
MKCYIYIIILQTDRKELFLDKSKNGGREAEGSEVCQFSGVSAHKLATVIHLSGFALRRNDGEKWRKTPGSQLPLLVTVFQWFCESRQPAELAKKKKKKKSVNQKRMTSQFFSR